MKLDEKHWTVPKNQKKTIFWSHEGFQPEIKPGLPLGTAHAEIDSNIGFFGTVQQISNKKPILLGQLYKYMNFQYNSNAKTLQIHSIYHGFAT